MYALDRTSIDCGGSIAGKVGLEHVLSFMECNLYHRRYSFILDRPGGVCNLFLVIAGIIFLANHKPAPASESVQYTTHWSKPVQGAFFPALFDAHFHRGLQAV